MKHSLRKTPSHLLLTYKYGEAAGGLLGRDLALEADGETFTLEVDLSANLRARNKSSAPYQAVMHLMRHHHKLKSVQCPDNLVRGRLIRAWESVRHPKLRLRLLMGEGTSYLYQVSPHSLFTGGIQLEVQACLDEEEKAPSPDWVAAGDNHPTDTRHRKHV